MIYSDDQTLADDCYCRQCSVREEPAAPKRYVATCAVCDWVGIRERLGRLGALADFDRHAATSRHADRWIAKVLR